MLIDLGFVPRAWQILCYELFRRFTILLVHRGAGKTIFAVMKLVDAALRFPGTDGRFAYIAPELKQAKDIAWTTLKHYARLIPGVQINESETWVSFPNSARIRLYGADNIDSLRGRHFDGIVIDEVAQMARDLWGLILLPALQARQGWALFIGTPDGVNLLSDLYYDAFNKPDWFPKLLTVYETHVFSADEIVKIKASMTERQFRQEYLCDINASGENILITIESAMAAADRDLAPHQYDFAPKILGVDVAWEGGDRCVIFPRQGLMAFDPVVLPGLPEKRFALRVAAMIESWRPDAVFVDTTGGYGGEVVSRLRDSKYKVREVVFSEKASQERFANLRSEMYFTMCRWILEGGSIPGDTILREELCAHTYSNENAASRVMLMPKKDVKEKIGRSPDLADALAITFAFPVNVTRGPGGFVLPRARHADARLSDFDPLSKERTHPDQYAGRNPSDFDPLRRE